MNLCPTEFHENGQSFNVDLLLLCNGNMFLFVLILNLINLVRKVGGKTVNSRHENCRNSFHVKRDEEVLARHKELCYEQSFARINMLTVKNAFLSSKSFQAWYYMPVVLYFDVESLLLPNESAQNDPDKSSQDTIEKLEPPGYCLVAIGQHTEKQLMMRLDRFSDCMSDFVKTIKVLPHDIYNKKQQFRNLTSAARKMDEAQAVKRWICEEDFYELDEKIVDHCHYFGRFIGYAHSDCNFQRRSKKGAPIVAHNLSNFDIHVWRYMHAAQSTRLK